MAKSNQSMMSRLKTAYVRDRYLKIKKKHDKPNIEKWQESLEVMLEF